MEYKLKFNAIEAKLLEDISQDPREYVESKIKGIMKKVRAAAVGNARQSISNESTLTDDQVLDQYLRSENYKNLEKRMEPEKPKKEEKPKASGKKKSGKPGK